MNEQDGTVVALPVEWFSVRAGSNYIKDGGIVSPVVQIINNENYHQKGSVYYNDLNLIFIEDALPLSRAIQLATLPKPWDTVPDGAVVSLFGWGYSLDFTIPDPYPLGYTTHLKQVDVYKVDRDICQDRYRQLEKILLEERNMVENFTILESMLCSGIIDVGGRGACTGDDGGPVVYNRTLVGVISWWSYRCAHHLGMTVSARVTDYLDWIDDVVSIVK
ncbi:trypsin domain-containing protein [Phthorimaea operculella]|nr:trypsin domain-containing protein [Phthorimaea operculella]